MTITNSFREAVSGGNVKGIRIMMKDSLLVDPSFTEFNEMSRIASGVSGLYDQHDGRELQSDISTWDDNYMDKLMVQIVGNFSKERLEHLKAVIKHLRPVTMRPQTKSSEGKQSSSTPRRKESDPMPRTQQPSYQEQKRRDQLSGNFRGAKITGGVVAGAVTGGVIAAVVSATVIEGAAIGAVAGGIVAAVVTNGE